MRTLLLSGALLVAPVAYAEVIEVSPEKLSQIPSNGDIWIYVQNQGNLSQYQARFISTLSKQCIEQTDFASPEVLDNINRKTHFSIDESSQLKGNRPVGFFDITFDIDVTIERDEFGTKVQQHLHNYNMFVDSAQFQFTLMPQSDSNVLVDLIASNQVSDDIPSWLSKMFQSDVGDKVQHFQNALNGLCD